MREKMISKREIVLILSFLTGIFLIANVSASIYLSQLNSVYNLGEMIQMDVQVSPIVATPMKITLYCDNSSMEVYKGAPTEIIQVPLNTLWTNGMTGDCYFSVNYNGETKPSVTFKISGKLEVFLKTDSFFAKPGESIQIEGSARRLSGEGINGNVEIKIPMLGSLDNSGINKAILYGKAANGDFSINFTIGKDTPPNNYKVNVIAYEENNGERTSEGIASADLQVFATLNSIDIAMDNQNSDPGKNISFKPILIDQSGNPLVGDSDVKIIDPNAIPVYEKILQSGETVNYNIPTNATAGYYEIAVSSQNKEKSKKFYVNEKPLVYFQLVNGTLIVKNIGNVPYNKSVQVDINGKQILQKINNLRPGDSIEYKLTGTQPQNSVKISDGESQLSEENAVLFTGAAVGVGNTGTGFISKLFNTPILWIIVAVIILAIILFLFKDIFKKKSVTYPAPSRERSNIINDTRIIKLDSKGREIGGSGNYRQTARANIRSEIEKKSDKTLTPIIRPSITKVENRIYGNPNYSGKAKPYWANNEKEEKKEIPQVAMPMPEVIVGQKKTNPTNEAEQVLVTDGQKNRASVIALKIKNQITKFSKENLEKSIEHVYEKKGAVYNHGNYVFVIFSPVLTKTFKNEIDACKGAEKIVEGLKEHNRKFAEKIEFGISVNSGEIINKVENKKLKFTSLGSLTIAAKKLADASNGEVLITKDAYEKAITEIKADKKIVNGIEVYELKKVADYDKNRKFINDFLKRENSVKGRSIPNYNS